jgi:hypothetical protein
MYAHGMRAIPARSVAGGEEDVGEKGQGLSAHLGVSGLDRGRSEEAAPRRSIGGGRVRPSPASSSRRGWA